jgi:dolichol-phosphate mannosyltransferase
MSPASLHQDTPIELSIIAPAHNEQDNVAGLVADVRDAMAAAAIPFELIIVDDGSVDSTLDRIVDQMRSHPWLRAFKMLDTPHGRGHGQSAAFHAGIRQARGSLIALIDADRQNDPSNLPAMVKLLHERDADMVQGDRSLNRADTVVRKFSSWVGRTFRGNLLGDKIRDTGCSQRVFKREVGLLLPLQYKGMHRFIPFYAGMMGFKVVEMSVRHHPRVAGIAKYGVWNRALPGLHDLFAVRWMRHRARPVGCKPIEADGEKRR